MLFILCATAFASQKTGRFEIKILRIKKFALIDPFLLAEYWKLTLHKNITHLLNNIYWTCLALSVAPFWSLHNRHALCSLP